MNKEGKRHIERDCKLLQNPPQRTLFIPPQSLNEMKTNLLATITSCPMLIFGANLAHYYDFESGYDDLIGNSHGAEGDKVTTSEGFDGGTAAVFASALSSGEFFEERGYVGLSPQINDLTGEFSYSYWV